MLHLFISLAGIRSIKFLTKIDTAGVIAWQRSLSKTFHSNSLGIKNDLVWLGIIKMFI